MGSNRSGELGKRGEKKKPNSEKRSAEEGVPERHYFIRLKWEEIRHLQAERWGHTGAMTGEGAW